VNANYTVIWSGPFAAYCHYDFFIFTGLNKTFPRGLTFTSDCTFYEDQYCTLDICCTSVAELYHFDTALALELFFCWSSGAVFFVGALDPAPI